MIYKLGLFVNKNKNVPPDVPGPLAQSQPQLKGIEILAIFKTQI